MDATSPQNPIPRGAARPAPAGECLALTLACLGIIITYGLLIDLKGIGTDEGFRLGIMNGGQPFSALTPPHATWTEVLATNSPYAYQPLYFLIQNTVMRVAGSADIVLLRCVNIFFLGVCLQGLLALSQGWQLVPRLFLLGFFSLNAYLFMHVLQLREYIVGVAFYVWSSWLVLQLDRRPLGRSWADTGWFAAYGGLLALGFFTQSWAVFPAIAQGLFLVLRPAGDRLRFYAHLAVSYVIVLSVAYPYLQGHRQKVDIGVWGAPDTQLWPRLADGLHLVLTGHSFGKSVAADFLFWFWLLLLAAGAGRLARRAAPGITDAARREYTRQGFLMVLCLGVAVAFQIGYFLKVDTLSVWPRYFALHYFFVTWLVALAFKSLHDLATDATVSAVARRRGRFAVGTALIMLAGAGAFQTWSYRRDPYFDTGLNPQNNWRVLSAGLARVIKAGDVVLTQDYLHTWTLTFTRPLANEVLSVQTMGAGPFDEVGRFVYLESAANRSARDEIIVRLARLGFGAVREETLPAPTAGGTIPAWRVLIFQRH